MTVIRRRVPVARWMEMPLGRIDGEPAIASSLAETLIEAGFHTGPRRLTFTAGPRLSAERPAARARSEGQSERSEQAESPMSVGICP